jgi:membrane protease YdiL (CAAX protease family)
MSRPTFIRIRTFLVPLAGVALYYFIQTMSLLFCSSFFKDNNTASLLAAHYGTYIMLTAVCMFVVLFIWLYVGRKSTYQTVKRDRLPFPSLLLAIPIALAMLGISNLYMLGVSALSEHILFIKNSLSDYAGSTSLPNSITGPEAVLYYIGAGICIPVVEELIFRGIILGEFLLTMKKDTAVILSAIVFGTMHMQLIQSGYAFICGLILGYAYLYSNSLHMSITLHVIFNLLGGILPLVFAKDPAVLNVIGIIEVLFILFGVLCILYLRKGYRNKILQEV